MRKFSLDLNVFLDDIIFQQCENEDEPHSLETKKKYSKNVHKIHLTLNAILYIFLKYNVTIKVNIANLNISFTTYKLTTNNKQISVASRIYSSYAVITYFVFLTQLLMFRKLK